MRFSPGLSGILTLLAGPMLAGQLLAGDVPGNIILFIGDGMGMNHVQAASLQKAFNEQRSPVESRLAFEDFPVTGYLTTHPAGDGDLVTDSAAAGTALACGVKTRNGVIGRTADGKDVDSVATIARKKGKAVGIVTTVALDDATPSVFYAHAGSRKETDRILDQAFTSTSFDVLMGGRILCKGWSSDTLSNKCEAAGLFYLSAAGLEAFVPASAAGRRVFGYLDVNAGTPSKSRATAAAGPREIGLPAMTRKALEVIVSRASTNGFFMMAEAGGIDGQSHGNNATNMVEKVLELSQAVAETIAFLKEKGMLQNTLVIVTADHETGGLVLGENLFLKNLAKSKTNMTGTAAGPIPEASRIGKVKVSWTLGGHTCTWVPLFACGPEAQRFAGRHDNTDVAKIIAGLMK